MNATLFYITVLVIFDGIMALMARLVFWYCWGRESDGCILSALFIMFRIHM